MNSTRILRFDGLLLQKTVNEVCGSAKLVGTTWQRFTEFNKLLKGHRPSELTILSGRTGVGKTTFLCEYSLDLAEQQVPTLWGSFEMGLSKICRTILHQFACQSLDNLPHDTVAQWGEAMRLLPFYFLEMQGPQKPIELFKVMEKAVKEDRVRHIILDNLQFMLGTEDDNFGSRFLRQDRFIEQLRQWINEHGPHVTLVVHPKKESAKELLNVNSLYGGGKVTQDADNVLLLQDESGLEDRAYPKKYVQIVKNRYDGELGRVQLKFQKSSLSYRSPEPGGRQLSDVQSSLVVTGSVKEMGYTPLEPKPG